MKIGSEPDKDPERVAAAKRAIGNHQLFVDANGAFSVKQALTFTDACPLVRGAGNVGRSGRPAPDARARA
jgi:hypothetical protein